MTELQKLYAAVNRVLASQVGSTIDRNAMNNLRDAAKTVRAYGGDGWLANVRPVGHALFGTSISYR